MDPSDVRAAFKNFSAAAAKDFISSRITELSSENGLKFEAIKESLSNSRYNSGVVTKEIINNLIYFKETGLKEITKALDAVNIKSDQIKVFKGHRETWVNKESAKHEETDPITYETRWVQTYSNSEIEAAFKKAKFALDMVKGSGTGGGY